MGIQHHHAEGGGFYSRSGQELYVKKMSFTSFGIEYFRVFHMIYTCKIVMDNDRAGFASVGMLNQETEDE